MQIRRCYSMYTSPISCANNIDYHCNIFLYIQTYEVCIHADFVIQENVYISADIWWFYYYLVP